MSGLFGARPTRVGFRSCSPGPAYFRVGGIDPAREDLRGPRGGTAPLSCRREGDPVPQEADVNARDAGQFPRMTGSCR